MANLREKYAKVKNGDKYRGASQYTGMGRFGGDRKFGEGKGQDADALEVENNLSGKSFRHQEAMRQGQKSRAESSRGPQSIKDLREEEMGTFKKEKDPPPRPARRNK